MAESSATMRTFVEREASFKIEHQLAKRRASDQKKKIQTTAIWPHTTPTLGSVWKFWKVSIMCS